MPAWSGLWNDIYPEGYSGIRRTNNAASRKLSRALRGLVALKYKEIVRTFVTDDVGTTAFATHTRIPVQMIVNGAAVGLGGKIYAEVVSDINRTLTAGDETELLKDVDGRVSPTFVADKSGNGGGGKIGF